MNLQLNRTFNFIAIFLALSFVTLASHAADEIIKTSSLKRISLDEIGILDSNNGGLSSDIWQGSNYDFIATILKNIPVKLESDIGKRLRRKILLTSAVPPKSGKEDSDSLLLIRLKLLALTGESNDLKRIMDKIPENRLTEEMQMINMAGLFIANNNDDACADSERLFDKYNSLTLRKTLILCNAIAKKQNEVDFGLKFLKEDGIKISEDLSKIIEGFSGDKQDDAAKSWKDFIIKESLTFAEHTESFPSFEKIINAPLPKSDVIKWLNSRKSMDKDKKLNEITHFYKIMDSLGVDISKSEWEQFITLPLSTKTIPPKDAINKILQIASEKNHKGEAIVLTLISMQGKTAANIPRDVLVNAINTLNNLRMPKEAADLAAEGIL